MGTKKHILRTSDGNVEIECIKGDPLSEDCPRCNEEIQQGIEKWLKLHEKYCLYCDESPKCFICLKKECEDWGADEHFIETYGTNRGCSRFLLQQYCSDFKCKYGFLGWWMRDWEKRRKEVRKEAWRKILHARRKAERNKRRVKKNAKSGKTKNNTTKVKRPV